MINANSIDVNSQPVWFEGENKPTNAKELRVMESQHACIHFINGLTTLLQERLGNMCQLLNVFTAQSNGTITQLPGPAVVGNSLSHGLLLTLRYTIEESS